MLLASVLAPALAAPQTAGQITFRDYTETTTTYINADTCTNNRDMFLTFTIRLTNSPASFPGTGVYRLYVQSQAISDADCAKSGQISGDIAVTSQTQTGKVSPASLLATTVGFTCAETSEKTIYMCIQGTDKDGNVFGVAKGQLTLSTQAPGAPTISSVESGDGALTVTWSEPSGTPEAAEYRLVAQSTRSTDPLADPAATPDDRDRTTHTATGITNPVDYRLDGLVNNVTYAVKVYATSKAGNEGEGSSPWVFGTPLPVLDFWGYYQASGGPEKGGCTTGGAGALAILGAAALLAARRRK